MSFRCSISLNRCFRARLLIPGFSALPWKTPRCWACTAGGLPWLLENIPPWCRFFLTQSVHMQICRRDSHQCRTSPEARSPETPDGTNQSICYRCCHDIMSCTRGLFLVPLPVWPGGGKPCPFQKPGLFLCSAHRARTRCWDLWWPPQTGPRYAADPPSTRASRDTIRGCCLQTQNQGHHISFFMARNLGFLCVPFSSTSCSWYFLRSATSFLYFSSRSLLASDISIMAADICQTKRAFASNFWFIQKLKPDFIWLYTPVSLRHLLPLHKSRRSFEPGSSDWHSRSSCNVMLEGGLWDASVNLRSLNEELDIIVKHLPRCNHENKPNTLLLSKLRPKTANSSKNLNRFSKEIILRLSCRQKQSQKGFIANSLKNCSCRFWKCSGEQLAAAFTASSFFSSKCPISFNSSSLSLLISLS